MSSPMRTKRLLRELRQLKLSQSRYVFLDATDNIDKWVIKLHGVEGTLYANEEFTLLFEFPADYPIEAPVERPERDEAYVKQAKASPKDTVWIFD
ncbi:putative ubiquitin-conjugating enzyme E2 17, partial [Coemansia sp. RSA 2424]